MSYQQDSHSAARALTHIAHAFTRFATATERIATALEQANKTGAQHDSQVDPIVLPSQGTPFDTRFDPPGYPD